MRLVGAEFLARPLTDDETVHHRDGHRSTNTIGPCFTTNECKCAERHNLELWSTKQPKGQRVSDKVAFAREILALYGHLVPEPVEPTGTAVLSGYANEAPPLGMTPAEASATLARILRL